MLLYREQLERLVLEPLRLQLALFVSITIAFTASALACSVIRENTCRAVTQLVVVIDFSFVAFSPFVLFHYVMSTSSPVLSFSCGRRLYHNTQAVLKFH